MGFRITENQWMAEGEKRYGSDQMNWKFRCPICGHVATGNDYKAAGAPAGAVAFSCIGRWMDVQRRAFGKNNKDTPKSPCDYAGGGFFAVNPITVIGTGNTGEEHHIFDFADNPLVKP